MHPQAHRHHRTRTFAALLPEQQRMAQPLKLQRRQRIGIEFRAHRPQPGAVTGPGQAAIEQQQHALQMLEGRLLLPHQTAELQQHRPLGLAFLALQLAQPVAQWNHRLGLDEHGAARGGAVVHQARQLAGGAGLHRQHRPAIALRDHAVLQQRGVAAQQLVQPIAALLAGRSDLAAQLGQGRTGPIGHAATVFDAEAQALLQLGQGAQLIHQRRGGGPQLGIIDLPAQPPRRRQGGGHIEQLIGGGHPALGAELNRAAQIRHPLKTEPPLEHTIEGQQFGGLRQKLAAGLKAGRQGQLAAEPAAGGGAGETGHVLPQPPPLEQLQRLTLDATQRSRISHGICRDLRFISALRKQTSRQQLHRLLSSWGSRHAGNTAIGSAPVLEGMPPAGS